MTLNTTGLRAKRDESKLDINLAVASLQPSHLYGPPRSLFHLRLTTSNCNPRLATMLPIIMYVNFERAVRRRKEGLADFCQEIIGMKAQEAGTPRVSPLQLASPPGPFHFLTGYIPFLSPRLQIRRCLQYCEGD